MKPTLAILTVTALILLGCAALQPGADPLVVRTEQTLSVANATFDWILGFDNSNRAFWRTNAPAFHNFCEWLRTPMPYMGTATVPRCVELQLNVDDLKHVYQASKTTTSSNALYSALLTLQGAIGQTTSWSNIVITPVHP